MEPWPPAYYKVSNTVCDNGLHTHTQPGLFYAQTFLHTNPFTHRNFYTQTLLHTDALKQRPFTHRRFYTQTLLHTDTFAQTVLHREPCTDRRFYTQILLHTQTPLHTEAFVQRHFYTQTLVQTTSRAVPFHGVFLRICAVKSCIQSRGNTFISTVSHKYALKTSLNMVSHSIRGSTFL